MQMAIARDCQSPMLPGEYVLLKGVLNSAAPWPLWGCATGGSVIPLGPPERDLG